MKHSARELMDIAYDTAKESFGKDSFNFAALWAKTWSKAKDFRKDSIENWIGAFYTELLIDPRFVYVGTHQWRLREFMDYTEYLREIGKRAQDVNKYSDPEDAEGDSKDKADAKTTGRKRGPRKKKEVVVETQEAEGLMDTEPATEDEAPETEEVNLDEDIERTTVLNPESEDDEDSYD
ncbi:DNA-directed RNA polymerase subunit delta [Mycoplasma ovis str. Michigan]|uniref:RNAP delta factor n=1 Tax=Mycoplasma ovis str. Michigan TaxID=1415773 RepID=A0ABN4BKQ0_9MOLU|nr:DNA-directed RNA polymerase subunit delta [Mycoplasma ovis]AHC39853.1 DNA-directed RNA polymerase subunit delta [Mycoplasma ovis str. Michigan]